MEESRRLTWSREIASGEVSNERHLDVFLAGTPRSDALVGVIVHPHLICRTADTTLAGHEISFTHQWSPT